MRRCGLRRGSSAHPPHEDFFAHAPILPPLASGDAHPPVGCESWPARSPGVNEWQQCSCHPLSPTHNNPTVQQSNRSPTESTQSESKKTESTQSQSKQSQSKETESKIVHRQLRLWLAQAYLSTTTQFSLAALVQSAPLAPRCRVGEQFRRNRSVQQTVRADRRGRTSTSVNNSVHRWPRPSWATPWPRATRSPATCRARAVEQFRRTVPSNSSVEQKQQNRAFLSRCTHISR